MAVCLLGGYAWRVLAARWRSFCRPCQERARAVLHTVFLGFVMSMVFARRDLSAIIGVRPVDAVLSPAGLHARVPRAVGDLSDELAVARRRMGRDGSFVPLNGPFVRGSRWRTLKPAERFRRWTNRLPGAVVSQTFSTKRRDDHAVCVRRPGTERAHHAVRRWRTCSTDRRKSDSRAPLVRPEIADAGNSRIR
jgi:hypothetical protein